ncbi:MAG: DUF4386 domain-containing protein [Rhizobiales bacterium]|nr:DUF4386 domain-containing protein [Hyphomicrobiales bacterium]NRB13129.1 DUF4386 domain-containing protein [Hyphomicrobiales bacterium]
MLPINNTARLAGLMYLLLIPLGIMAMIYIPMTLIIDGDIATTMANIKANILLFRLASVSVYLVQLVNLFLVYLLFRIFSKVNIYVTWSMVILIVTAIPIAWVNELNYAAILHILAGDDPSPAQVALFLNLHVYGINIAQIFWGLWLFPMGYLVYKSGFMPKFVGILLMIGCFGYLVDSFIFFINPNFEIKFAEFLFLGEVVMTLWLLIKGVNAEKWHEIKAN